MITYADKEQARYWPVSKELMAQYRDSSHTEKDRNGNLIWLKNGLRHRDGDKPAYIGVNGNLGWYQNGELHRDGDKPAVIGRDGDLIWYKNGQRHRICGPSRIYASGRLKWWINGKDITLEVNLWLNGLLWRGTIEQIVEFQLRFA